MLNETENCVLHIQTYLWDHTNGNHTATIDDIIGYLSTIEITAGRKKIARD